MQRIKKSVALGMLVFLTGCMASEVEIPTGENDVFPYEVACIDGVKKTETDNSTDIKYYDVYDPEKNYTETSKVLENNEGIAVACNYSAGEIYINSRIRVLDIAGIEGNELLEMLGGKFELFFKIEGGWYEYYSYSEDIVVIFNPTDRFNHMFLRERADINGARMGMSKAEVQEILGEGRLVSGGMGIHAYYLRYEYEEFGISFGLRDNDIDMIYILW